MSKTFLVISLAVVLCLSVSCTDQAAMAELEKYRTQAKAEEQNKKIVKRSIEIWNKADFGSYKKLVTSDYGYYSPSRSEKSLSIEETTAFGKMLFEGFPDAKWTIEDIIAQGDKVVIRLNFNGTHTGTYNGITATGSKVYGSSIVILALKNGLIAEERDEYDNLSFMQQLGMELKPKQ